MNETDGFDSDAPKAPASAPEPEPPRWPYFRHFVFAKNCTNKYGHFRIGDRSRDDGASWQVQADFRAKRIKA